MSQLRLPTLIALCLIFFPFTFAKSPSDGTGPLRPDGTKWHTARTMRGAGLERDVDLAVPLRTHSIYAPYVDSDLQNRWFSFGADAYVNTNKHIRLTRGVPSQCGWVWSRLPVTASNWRIEVEFKISGKATHLYGDGMAVWLTTERAVEGPVFCSKDKFNGLGIFIDTYANSHHTYAFPRVMAMLGDGKTEYDLGNDGKANSIAACSAKVRRTDITTKLRMTYFRDDFFQVQVQYKGFDDWTDCFVIKNMSIPLNPFLGVTAQTGDIYDEHDLISINTHSMKLANADKIHTAHDSDSHGDDDDEGGFISTLLTLIFFGAICAAGFLGFRAYQAKKGKPWDPKRF
ncbi:hypothetical protein M408DRAFT_328060 [Serendipita vermifera MAFF 305830]|uniref:L-type lectin-like domain-containing protein n=1 Tax=Serendipita vermifera MAFF 305830 TaxID=933852 RepID=A0A0C2XNB0_SERVB|nr:hypothetical protein M408DRAFT_328060 [Serendipita vermifera MAFF 305830]